MERYSLFIHKLITHNYSTNINLLSKCYTSNTIYKCPAVVTVHSLLCFAVFSLYKARHAHKRLYTVLPKYSKIQVLPGITSCRLVKDNKQAIELNSLLINSMPKGGYE